MCIKPDESHTVPLLNLSQLAVALSEYDYLVLDLDYFVFLTLI